MYGRYARNAVPVEPVLNPSAGFWRYVYALGGGHSLHASIAQVTSVEVLAHVVLGSPKITACATNHGRPVGAALHGGASIAEREVSLWVFLCKTTFDLEPLVCFFLQCGAWVVAQTHVDGRHVAVEVVLFVGCACHRHVGIVYGCEPAFAVRMTTG